MAGIFTDHAVLQRGMDVCIWGYSDLEKITFSLVGENDKVERQGGCDAVPSSEDNKLPLRFEFCIKAMPSGGPYELCVSDGTDTVRLEDIYFGEVWIAGGQSNMELELQNSKNGTEEVAEADNPFIRFFYTPKVAYEGPELDKAWEESRWKTCKPENVSNWSAVGYYFAKCLTEELEDDVMIGIIGCNWGGTSASAWMSREKLAEYPETNNYLVAYDKATEGLTFEDHLKAWKEYEIYQAEFDKKVGEYYQTHENPTWDEAISLCGENRYPGPPGPCSWTRPAGLYGTMIKKVAPYTLGGAIYYQGEDDDNRPYWYKRLLTSMIEQWREDFRDPELPFFIVQLPIFVNENEEDDKNWPLIREAQAAVAKEVSGCGLAVILETGEYHNIHPLDKETVGYRLGFQALHKVFGTMGIWDANGPFYDSSFPDGSSFYVNITCCDQGLMVDDDDMFLTDVRMQDYLPEDAGFEIAGDDGVYYPARAQVLRADSVEALDDEDDSDNGIAPKNLIALKLTSKDVPNPTKARYFWKNYGKVKVYGSNGIPLCPFRTDIHDGFSVSHCRQGEILGTPDLD